MLATHNTLNGASGPFLHLSVPILGPTGLPARNKMKIHCWATLLLAGIIGQQNPSLSSPLFLFFSHYEFPGSLHRGCLGGPVLTSEIWGRSPGISENDTVLLIKRTGTKGECASGSFLLLPTLGTDLIPRAAMAIVPSWNKSTYENPTS